MKYNPPSHSVRDTFHQGLSRRAYEMLGAHPCEEGEVRKWHFCVWAPNARQVSLVGSFNGWDAQRFPMQKQYDGTWELRLSEEELLRDVPEDGVPVYKYAILGADGKLRLKADPYGFYAELRPNMGSRLYDLDGYPWQDQAWMERRSTFNPYVNPINIYEVHIGSWRRHEDGSLLTYLEFADQLIPT